MGTAKIGILAYETKTGNVYQQGGQSLARSDDTKWFLLGSAHSNRAPSRMKSKPVPPIPRPWRDQCLAGHPTYVAGRPEPFVASAGLAANTDGWAVRLPRQYLPQHISLVLSPFYTSVSRRLLTRLERRTPSSASF